MITLEKKDVFLNLGKYGIVAFLAAIVSNIGGLEELIAGSGAFGMAIAASAVALISDVLNFLKALLSPPETP